MRMTRSDSTSTAFVTGGGSGLGRAVSLRLARRGDRVVVADRDHAAALETAQYIHASGGTAEAVLLDVTDVDAVIAAVRQADADGPVDTAVSCAGIARPSPLLASSPDELGRALAVNVTGTYALVRAAAEVMVPRERGAIVTIGSTSSYTASSTPMFAYDTSKAAVRMLTASVGRELAPRGVRVNGVAPGTMDTPLMRSLGADDDSLASMAAARIPAGRLGRTDEVADAVAFLSGPEASYMVGQMIVVDGGWLA